MDEQHQQPGRADPEAGELREARRPMGDGPIQEEGPIEELTQGWLARGPLPMEWDNPPFDDAPRLYLPPLKSCKDVRKELPSRKNIPGIIMLTARIKGRN